MIGSSKQTDLAKVTRFLRANPKYELLLRHLRELPDHLLLPGDRSKLLPPVNGANKAALGRHFRKEYFRAFRYQNSSKYMNTIARQLGGRVSTFQAMGRYTTWYIPAIIGAYNVTQASPEDHLRTGIQEGFAILGGALGTYLGGTVVAAGVASVLCLGPFGIFVVAFICGAAGGIFLSELFKMGASSTIDYFDSERIYQSPHEILESIR